MKNIPYELMKSVQFFFDMYYAHMDLAVYHLQRDEDDIADMHWGKADKFLQQHFDEIDRLQCAVGTSYNPNKKKN